MSSPNTLRDYLSGARRLPAWAPLALGREAQLAYLSALVEPLPEHPGVSDPPPSRTGTEG